MTPDASTPCPACPREVRALYLAAQLLVKRLDQGPSVDAIMSLIDDELRMAVNAVKPFVDAHEANQVHAHSAELASAREPQLQEVRRG
jgi:hypothetical protein